MIPSGKTIDVSVVMPAFNIAPYLADAVMSVISQTYKSWELLIVDDCSRDATLEVAQRFAQVDSRIRVFSLSSRRGAAHARNLAIKEARGRFIAFLDGDDLWLPQKLERQIPEMLRSEAAFSFTAYRKMNSKGEIGAGIIHVPRTVTYKDLLKTCVVGCLTAVYDTWRTGKVYMPSIARRHDYALWLRILRGKSGEPMPSRAEGEAPVSGSAPLAIGIDEPLAVYRVHGQGISSNKVRAAYYQWMIYRHCENLSLSQSLYNFLHYAYHGYKKSRIW